MNTPFKMSPKQGEFIESIRKKDPKAAKKIEAGIRAKEKKGKEDVNGAMLMDKNYAIKMGGYTPIKKVGDKKSDASGAPKALSQIWEISILRLPLLKEH